MWCFFRALQRIYALTWRMCLEASARTDGTNNILIGEFEQSTPQLLYRQFDYGASGKQTDSTKVSSPFQSASTGFQLIAPFFP